MKLPRTLRVSLLLYLCSKLGSWDTNQERAQRSKCHYFKNLNNSIISIKIEVIVLSYLTLEATTQKRCGSRCNTASGPPRGAINQPALISKRQTCWRHSRPERLSAEFALLLSHQTHPVWKMGLSSFQILLSARPGMHTCVCVCVCVCVCMCILLHILASFSEFLTLQTSGITHCHLYNPMLSLLYSFICSFSVSLFNQLWGQ